MYSDVHDLTYGKSKLQQKVTAYLRKTEKQSRVARPQATKTATMADQQPLPAFTLGSLPFVVSKKINKEEDMDTEE